ncbi:MAG: HAD family phosphatase [Kistimonas sp.]|nr:HAD family phosphatase [Kistimonas sp.]
MLSHPSALLLDMDGTLFSSESLYKRIWQSAAQACSLSLSDAFYARHFIGHSFNTCLDAVQGLAGEDFDMKRFLRQLAACEKEARASPAKPGSRALLDWAGRQGLPLGLVTSGSRQSVQDNFASIGGTGCFLVLVTREDATCAKPAPEPYQLACQQLGLRPEQTLAVEDSDPGALSALTAGCCTVIVPDMLPPSSDVSRRALAVLSSLEQLPQWIMNNQHKLGVREKS